MAELGVITISPRIAIHQELEETRQAFHSLLASLDDQDLYQPSADPAWTVGEVLIQLVMGIQVVQCKTQATQLGLRLPGLPASLCERLNLLHSRQAFRHVTRFSIGRKYDLAYTRLVKILQSVSDNDWQKSGCCNRSMEGQYISPTIEELFHSISNNFESRAEEIRHRPLGLPAVLPRPMTQAWPRSLLIISLFSLTGALLAWLVSRVGKRKKL